MKKEVNNQSIEVIKDVLRQYLKDKGLRNTPERYTILEEIYNYDEHFNVDDLYLLMLQRKYHISKATIYNTIEVFLDANTNLEKALLMKSLILTNNMTIWSCIKVEVIKKLRKL